MTQPAQLTFEGPVSEIAVNVLANTPALVGMPGLSIRNIDDLLAQYPDIVSVRSYDMVISDWTVYDAPGPSYLNTLREMRPALGYWIVSSADITLTVPPAGTTYFYHADHLGSTNVITDEDGNLIFTRKQVFDLNTKSASVISRLNNLAQELNSIGAEEEEELEKNLEGDQSEGSGSN